MVTKEVIAMIDYQKMYLSLFDKTEQVINILIEAQKQCEEIYILSERSSDETQEKNSSDTDK